MVKSLLLVGVGGQGTILVSRVISQGLLEDGYDVKMSEIHGMSQRGGSVTTQIRFGKKVHSPNITKGEADLIMAFEKVEAVRYIDHLKKNGVLVVNDEEIYPLSVLTGAQEYPEGVIDKLEESIDNVEVVEAKKISKELGEPRSQNIVMLGAMVKHLGIEDIDWIKIIKENLPENVHEVNVEAFKKGLAT